MALKPIRRYLNKSGGGRKDSRRWKTKTNTFIGASGGITDTYIFNRQSDNTVLASNDDLKIGTVVDTENAVLKLLQADSRNQDGSHRSDTW